MRCRCRILEDLHITRVRTPSSSLVTSISRESTISPMLNQHPLPTFSTLNQDHPSVLPLHHLLLSLTLSAVYVGLLVFVTPLSVSNHCHHSARQHLHPSSVPRTTIERGALRGFVCRVGDAVSTTHSTRRQPCLASKDNQRSEASHWQRLLSVCI